MTAREHARLLGLLFWIYAGVQIAVLLFSLVFVTAMFGGMISAFSNMPDRADQPDPGMIFGFMGVIIFFAVILAILMLIPKVVAGYGLRNDKRWSKVWAIIGCCLAVLSVPFGTALGVYGFWFIFGDQGKSYFENNLGSSQIPPPPPPNSWQ